MPSDANLSDLLGQHVEGACRLVLRHERTRTFRPWGILELVLKALAAILLIPFWIYLLLTTLYVEMEAGDEGSTTTKEPEKREKNRLTKSPFFTYRHEVVVQALGPEGKVLAESRTVPRSEDEGLQLVASTVRLAQPARLAVVETVALDGSGAQEVVRVWHGGRPLMSAPDLRSANSLVDLLAKRGYAMERRPDGATVRLRKEPMNFVIACLLAIGGPLLAIGLLAVNPLLWILLPAALFGVWLMRRQAIDLAQDVLFGLTKQAEEHELQIAKDDVSYRFRHAWRHRALGTSGDVLVAVNDGGTLGWESPVDREPNRLLFVGRRGVLALPSDFSADGGPALHEWITSALLALRQDGGVHDYRSRCSYCAVLVDFEHDHRCTFCGAPPLAA